MSSHHRRLPFSINQRTPGPWPWSDFREPVTNNISLTAEPGRLPDAEQATRLKNYCKDLYGGWESSRKAEVAFARRQTCNVYHADVKNNGDILAYKGVSGFLSVEPGDGYRARILFVEHLTEPMLQVLGTTYNIDHDFFRACFDTIVSQSRDKMLDPGDHIRITLPFLRTQSSKILGRRKLTGVRQTPLIGSELAGSGNPFDDILLDLMGIYMIRSNDKNTVLCYSPLPGSEFTSTAMDAHAWFLRTGRDTYWEDIFKQSKDSTFTLLPILWYLLYAWADALESLYLYLNKLEGRVLETANITLTQQLHEIRVSLLNYQSLLEDFKKTIVFLFTTPNPTITTADMLNLMPSRSTRFFKSDIHHAVFNLEEGRGTDALEFHDTVLTSPIFNVAGPLRAQNEREPEAEANTEEQQYRRERAHFEKECTYLRTEVDRLQGQIVARNERIKDVMMLVFSRVTIRDSTAMKQISYITMLFIPATFIAGVFGMNVHGIGVESQSLMNYIETAIPFTVLTIWVLVAFQSESQPNESPLTRLLWPYKQIRNTARYLVTNQNRNQSDMFV